MKKEIIEKAHVEYKEVFSDTYLNINYEIVKRPPYQDLTYLFNNDEYLWSHYIYINIDQQIPNKELADSFWLKPEMNNGYSKSWVVYNYFVYPIDQLIFHGGCTHYSKISNIDALYRVVKIGCDYQHLWDKDRYYNLDYIINQCKYTIDSLWQLTPINKHCLYCGNFSPESDFDESGYCICCKEKRIKNGDWNEDKKEK